MLITILGTNTVALENYQNSLISDFLKTGDELALEKIDAETVGFETIISSVRSVPFLSDKKLVLIKDIQANLELCEKIDMLLDSVSDTTDLVINANNLDKRSLVYKTLQKRTEIKTFAPLDTMLIVNELQDLFSKSSVQISRQDIVYIVNRVSANHQKAINEANKLILFSGKISKDEIDSLVEVSLDSKVFDLVDSVFRGDVKSVAKQYAQQRNMRVEPQSILGLVIWQINLLSIVSSTKISEQGSLSAQGFSPFALKKSIEIIRYTPKKVISSVIDSLCQVDLQIKTYTADVDYALKYFLVNVAQKIKEAR
jgi:DNA polymerase-3 subunit delta